MQDECVYALSCSDFDAYLGSIGDPYPCQAEEEATDAACGDFMTVLEPAEAACF